ncbi:hypothetical protein T492DRAFT_843571 [Pavlovales sp. CCMP2436]|nr:hypothetical protein T492DRAFT_843571 [Pavlovales sp. CCMP2436]
MLHASLLEPSPSEQLAARALEREAALATQLDLNALTLGFRSRELERAYAPFRDALSARALRSGLFWLACAYIPLEVSLELWQYTHHGAIAHFAWAFALVAAAALTAAFAASHGRGAHADTIGCLLLVTLAAAIVGRASYARVDPLAPPVAVSLFFFVAAGPPILRLRFVAMAATFLGIVCAHFAAIRLRRSKSENAPWYEVSLGLAGVLSALSCRWLEHGQRREFYLMALLAAAEAEGGSSGLPPGECMCTASRKGALLLDDGSLGASRARHTPVDEALRELRELAHRLTQHLPHQHLASLLEARVPTDAMERALEEAGVSSLAELLFSGHGSHGLPHAHAHLWACGISLRTDIATAAAAAASGAPAELTAAALTIENGALSGWAVVAAAREAGGPVRLVTSDALPPYFSAYAYVHTAYRVELSGWQALASVLQWHNETLNVWTELLPAAAFAAAIAEFLRDAAVVGDLPAVDRCLLSIGLVVALIIRPIW